MTLFVLSICFHLIIPCQPLRPSPLSPAPATTSPAPAASSRSGIDRSGLKMLCTTLAPSRRLDIDTTNPLRTEYWAVGGLIDVVLRDCQRRPRPRARPRLLPHAGIDRQTGSQVGRQTSALDWHSQNWEKFDEEEPETLKGCKFKKCLPRPTATANELTRRRLGPDRGG